MSISGISGYNSYQNYGTGSSYAISLERPEKSDAEQRAAKRAGLVECETCKNRKYQDGSNEGDVSFKAPGHISPQASAATVASHEAEHVANAYQKASEKGGRVVQASVSYQMGVCPECGRSYVAGGLTNTMIKYNKSTPYGDNQQKLDEANGAKGANVDIAV